MTHDNDRPSPSTTWPPALRLVLPDLQVVADPHAEQSAAHAACSRCGGTVFLRYDVPVGDPYFGQVKPYGCKTDEQQAAQTASFERVFHEVRNTEFLVLDEYGVQSATPWAVEKLYQVLNYRCDVPQGLKPRSFLLHRTVPAVAGHAGAPPAFWLSVHPTASRPKASC